MCIIVTCLDETARAAASLFSDLTTTDEVENDVSQSSQSMLMDIIGIGHMREDSDNHESSVPTGNEMATNATLFEGKWSSLFACVSCIFLICVLYVFPMCSHGSGKKAEI